MKITQMKFQKIAVKFMFIMAILTVAYSLIMSSQLFDFFIMDADRSTISKMSQFNTEPMKRGLDLFYGIQDFNKAMFTISVIFLIVSITLFVFFCQSRRKYYITNYVVLGVVSLFALVLSFYALPNIFDYRAWYKSIDMDAITKLYDNYNTLTSALFGDSDPLVVKEISSSTWSFDIGIIIFVLLIVAAIMLIANAIWKVIDMKKDAEKFGAIDNQIRESWAKYDKELYGEETVNEN